MYARTTDSGRVVRVGGRSLERLHPTRVQAGAPDIQLVLTRLSGNPDLYVSLTAPAPTTAATCLAPTCWKSTDAEGDVVMIPHTDPKLIECIQAQEGANALPCTLHMAVVGVEASRFSLLPSAIKVRSGRPHLSLKQPLTLALTLTLTLSLANLPLTHTLHPHPATLTLASPYLHPGGLWLPYRGARLARRP